MTIMGVSAYDKLNLHVLIGKLFFQNSDNLKCRKRKSVFYENFERLQNLQKSMTID